MIIFIDESGDAGFKLDRCSSPVFCAVMVIFNDEKEAERTSAAIKALQETRKIYPEFKFSGTHWKVKDAFFKAVAPFDFKVRAIIVRKERLRSQHLKAQTRRFYNFFVRMMMSHDGGSLKGARVKIDGSGSRKFKRELSAYLKRQTKNDALGRVTFHKSHADHLIQLADMVSGAIYRSYHPEKTDHTKWRNMLAPKIEDVWEFS